MISVTTLQPHIKKLPPHLVNQIAAGEVIERPAAVIKELVENAIDAGAEMVEVAIRHGGKSYIKVKDNGSGMSPEDLSLAFERHATSKLVDEDLFNIHTYGFRGEALPSIASISRVAVVTCCAGSTSALELEAGRPFNCHPGLREDDSPSYTGTTIEIFDLFFATPARLKFLKTDGYETLQCVQMIKRLALANHQVGFKLHVDDSLRLDLPKRAAVKERVKDVWESTELDDLRFFDYEKDGLTLTGCISVPTCHRAQGDAQYFYVNGRFVKDKIFAYALKLAYGDRIPPRRFPLACVFLTLPSDSVDVNVHPCKTEVRFLEESLIRKHLATAMNGTLTFGGALQTTQRLADDFVTLPVRTFEPVVNYTQPRFDRVIHAKAEAQENHAVLLGSHFQALPVPAFTETTLRVGNDISSARPILQTNHLPHFYLGTAVAQIFKTYIISHTHDKTFIVDQHAAHERITYEKYKAQKASFLQQKLALPLIVPISPEQKALLEEFRDGYAKMGFGFSIEGANLELNSVPAIVPTSLYSKIIQDTLDHLVHYEAAQNMETVIDSILATMACHNSIRKGQILSVMEMDALLRAMEKTPNIAQCNHGRPTYIELQRGQLDRLFERS